ncbi:MAG: hypothetical protein AB7Q17_11745 [Phycisphaerae bacterium]
MAIEFHCEFCGKPIRTADEHAGKRGKCPSCHQAVYIPTPSEQIETLGLEPLDRGFIEQQEKLLRETRDLTSKMLRERAADAGDAGPRHAASQDLPIGDDDVEPLVVSYAVKMADGDLVSADELARELRKHWAVAEKIIQRLTIDEMPHPTLARIPRPVLVGFFKRLREKK